MNTQKDCDLVVVLTSDDMTASFVPSCFDDYLAHKKMGHIGARRNTNSKLQSDYDLQM